MCEAFFINNINLSFQLFLDAGVNVNASKALPFQKPKKTSNGAEKATDVLGFTPLYLAVYAASSRHYEAVQVGTVGARVDLE